MTDPYSAAVKLALSLLVLLIRAVVSVLGLIGLRLVLGLVVLWIGLQLVRARWGSAGEAVAAMAVVVLVGGAMEMKRRNA